MTALILRIVLFAAIGIAIAWGARKIWRDWTGAFRSEDRDRLARDRRERDLARGDMITLKRDKDGKFRPDE